jgi:hypothetical protein
MADFFVSGSWPKKGGTTGASGYGALVPYRDGGFFMWGSFGIGGKQAAVPDKLGDSDWEREGLREQEGL